MKATKSYYWNTNRIGLANEARKENTEFRPMPRREARRAERLAEGFAMMDGAENGEHEGTGEDD